MISRRHELPGRSIPSYRFTNTTGLTIVLACNSATRLSTPLEPCAIVAASDHWAAALSDETRTTTPRFWFVVHTISFLIASCASSLSLNGMKSGIKIIRSLTPANEREVSGFWADCGSASKVRTSSLSAAMVADMEMRRGASTNVGKALTRGNIGVSVNASRLMSARQRCNRSRKSGHTSAYSSPSDFNCSRAASICSCQAQSGTSRPEYSAPATKAKLASPIEQRFICAHHDGVTINEVIVQRLPSFIRYGGDTQCFCLLKRLIDKLHCRRQIKNGFSCLVQSGLSHEKTDQCFAATCMQF